MNFFSFVIKLLKWVGVAAGATAVTVAIAGISVFSALQVSFVQDRVAYELEKWFFDKTGASLRISALSGSIPRGMVLEGVVIIPPIGNDPVITAKRIDVGLKMTSLFDRPIQFEAIRIDSAVVDIRSNQSIAFFSKLGDSGKDDATTEPEKTAVSFNFPEFVVSNTSIYLAPGFTGLDGKDIDLKNVTVHAGAKVENGIFGLQLDTLLFNLPDFSTEAFLIQSNVEIGKGMVSIRETSVKNGGSAVLANAEIRPRTNNPGAGAAIDLSIQKAHIVLSDWAVFLPEEVIKRGIQTVGVKAVVKLENEFISVSDMSIQADEASFLGTVEVGDFRDAQKRHILVHIEKSVVPTKWIMEKDVFPSTVRYQPELSLNGTTELLLDQLKYRGDVVYGRSTFEIDASLNPLKLDQGIQIRTGFKRLNLKDILTGNVADTRLTGWASAKVVPGADLFSTTGSISARLLSSRINEVPLTSARFEGKLQYGTIKSELEIQSGAGSGKTNFFADFGSSELLLLADGKVEGIDLNKLIPGDVLHKTLLNGSFDLKAQGSTPETFYGSLAVDFDTSFVNNRIVPYHQFYVDLNAPSEKIRRFRFASSMVDLEITGVFNPAKSGQTFVIWANEIGRKVQKELLLNQLGDLSWTAVDPVDAEVGFQIKDPVLAADYSSVFEGFQSKGRADATIKLNNENASIRLNYADDELIVQKNSIFKPTITISALFHQGFELKDKSSVSLEVRYDSLKAGKFQTGGMVLNLNQFNETARMTLKNDQLARFGSIYADIDLLMTVETLDFSFRKVQAGFKNYEWMFADSSGVAFTNENKWAFRNFAVVNGAERIQLTGTLSEDASDSVAVVLKAIDLKRISDLIQYDFGFSGRVDGLFTTRTLKTAPDIRGNLFADGVRFEGRIVGDMSLSSVFDPERKQFLTNLTILTDPNKYAAYLTSNKGIGQDISVSGFIKSPVDLADDELMFSFQTEVRSLDVWAINEFLPEIFQKMEGRTVGSGSLAGSKSSVQFHLEMDVQNCLIVPLFLNTTYFLSGPLIVDRREGVRFENLSIRDSFSGYGTANGYIDWNDFKPKKALFFEGDMTNLQFLNNYYVTDIPFFGNISGSGKIRLSGYTNGMILQTIGPCTVTPGSQLSLPLLDVEDIEEKTNYIEFSDSDTTKKIETKVQPQEKSAKQKTFVELFTMNLQFNIPSMSSVQLLFDPVINEAINAEGSGEMAITLEKEVFKLYGKLDIARGDYLFNGGDLITRRFVLQPGGVISWDGDPVNGYLNARAAYRARPDISPVLPNATYSADNTRNRVFVPLNLVLHMSGPLFQLQNDFFFELESSVATSQDANILTAINTLNNPQTKLVQASALMLTGGFLEDSQTQQTRLGSDFDSKVTQNYFAQLLSNQINSVLSKKVSNVDVSLNMQGFNQFSQTELGVALRLFDDRLVLRREGQIAGQNSNIGDLGATYRINEYLSVEAFHKQDPSQNLFQQNAAAGTQQTINGVGLEAQVQFETWKDLRKKTSGAFKRLFGGNKKTAEAPEPVAQRN